MILRLFLALLYYLFGSLGALWAVNTILLTEIPYQPDTWAASMLLLVLFGRSMFKVVHNGGTT